MYITDIKYQKRGSKMSKCVITGKEIVGDSHDAQPVCEGRCSEEACYQVVIPYRLFLNNSKNKMLVLTTDNKIETYKPKDKYFKLEELQQGVEGYIEIYPKRFNGYMIICNEEGRLKNMKPNRLAKIILGLDLVGSVVLVEEKVMINVCPE